MCIVITIKEADISRTYDYSETIEQSKIKLNHSENIQKRYACAIQVAKQIYCNIILSFQIKIKK